MKKKIGIIGCGSIGIALAKFIRRYLLNKAEITAICDTDKSKAESLADILGGNKIIANDIDILIKKCDLIIESASAKVSYLVAKKALVSGKDVLVMSIGGILPHIKELTDLAGKNKSSLYLPSGAICGIDGLKALAVEGIDKVKLITRKPPLAFSNVEYLKRKGIDVRKIKKEKVIFKGKAYDAVRKFPQNINVAALLSIAGIGMKKTEVVIIAVGGKKVNSHEIIIESKAGKISINCDNVAFKDNPKTSFLAALSAMSVLKNMFNSVKIGG